MTTSFSVNFFAETVVKGQGQTEALSIIEIEPERVFKLKIVDYGFHEKFWPCPSSRGKVDCACRLSTTGSGARLQPQHFPGANSTNKNHDSDHRKFLIETFQAAIA